MCNIYYKYIAYLCRSEAKAYIGPRFKSVAMHMVKHDNSIKETRSGQPHIYG